MVGISLEKDAALSVSLSIYIYLSIRIFPTQMNEILLGDKHLRSCLPQNQSI
jgi:hypothetical protein